MAMVFNEVTRFCEVGMVTQDGDMGGRPVVSWLNLFTPFREGGICEPHLLEEVLLAAIQPFRRNQGAVLEGCGSCRSIVGEAIEDFIYDFLGELDSHDDSEVSASDPGTWGV